MHIENELADEDVVLKQHAVSQNMTESSCVTLYYKL